MKTTLKVDKTDYPSPGRVEDCIHRLQEFRGLLIKIYEAELNDPAIDHAVITEAELVKENLAWKKLLDEQMDRIEELEAKCRQRRDDLKQARDILDERFKRIEELEGDLQIMRLQRDAKHVSRCQCADEVRCALKAENERLRGRIEQIASQIRPCECDDEQMEMADFETAYDMCVLEAREALNNE